MKRVLRVKHLWKIYVLWKSNTSQEGSKHSMGKRPKWLTWQATPVAELAISSHPPVVSNITITPSHSLC